MIIRLGTPLPLAGRTLIEIELRPPGTRVIERMRSARLPGGLTDAQVITFAARLSTHSEATLRRLAPADLDNVKSALEALYAQGARRLRARAVIAAGEEAKNA